MDQGESMGNDASVISFPVHRRSTLEETMAGFPAWGGPDGPTAARRERPVTLLLTDIRGWESLAARMGPNEAGRRLEQMVDEVVGTMTGFGGVDVTVGGERTLPVMGARFEGPNHALRAVHAAVNARETVSALQRPSLPGNRLQVCSGINSGAFVEADLYDGARVSFQSVGTVRMYAIRLEEFAGPGQIFLSSRTLRELEGAVRVRSIGSVRTNPDGETDEAFALSELLTGVPSIPRSETAAVAPLQQTGTGSAARS